MLNSADLYLGSFLILCGFALSLLNLKRIVQERNSTFPSVLFSENLMLTCIGIAFVIRSIHKIQPYNTMDGIEERSGEVLGNEQAMDCNFTSILMSYGPLIVSLVNSFLSLIIDNYMHYKMIVDMKNDEEESTVRSINDDLRLNTGDRITRLFSFTKKYFTFIAVAMQWIVPILIALSMYPIDVKEKKLLMDHSRSLDNICMAMMDARNENCSLLNNNYTFELREHIPNYLEMHENDVNTTNNEFDSIVGNVFRIIANLQNDTIYDVNVTSQFLRRPKIMMKCMKVCYVDNNNLILYVFVVAVISYFVPITISTVILTKIHMMDVTKRNVKTYVSRELLYNILFWTPVMFDTFLSLALCSYSMNGTRTSIFNVIANIYQAIKNFMNTKYFKDNTINPM